MKPATPLDDRTPLLATQRGHGSSAEATLADELGILASDVHVPTRFADYYELTKPRLNFLVVVTTVVGYYIAARVSGSGLMQWTIIHTLLGTALTAASAAVLNQVVERDFDALMRRTRNRPIPAGRVSQPEGLIFGATLGFAGVGYLAFATNPLTAFLGVITWITYLLIYTPMKRRSPMNTLVGAITGALPPAMGVTAVTGTITPLAAALFAILFVWQMPHFFALALMYKDDYATGGFRMLPNAADGDRRTRTQIVLFTAALLPISLIPVLANVSLAGWVYAIGATLLGLMFLRAAIACAWRTPGSEKRLFLASIAYLPALLAVLMIDQ